MPSVTTPYRETRIELDLDETVAVTPPWGGVRSGAEIASAVALGNGSDNQYAQGVRYWPGSRTWTLQPVQEKMSQFHEKLPAGILPEDLFYLMGEGIDIKNQAGFRLVNLLGPIGTYAIGEIGTRVTRGLPGNIGFEPGTSILDGLLDRGDSLYQRRVASGKSWASGNYYNVPSAPQNQFGGAPLLINGLPGANVALDAIVHSFKSQRADQGFFLRWSVPGTRNQFPDYVLNFYFGQFLVAIRGDGNAKLLEWCRAKPETPHRWVLRLTWQYCRPGQAVGNTHTLLIYPQIGPFGDRYIHFSNNQLDSANVYGPSAATSEITWLSDPVTRGGDVDEVGPGHVTKEAPIRLDHRRDIRPSWQISKLMFVSQGVLRDAAFPRRPYLDTSGTNVPFEINVDKRLPSLPPGSIGSGFDIVAQFYDTVTGNPFVPGVSASYSVRYPACQFTFKGAVNPATKGACDDTPILDSYGVWQDTQTRRLTPGKLTKRGILEFSMEGGDREPQNEHAQVSVHDATDALARLRQRGEISARVVVEMLPPGETTPVDVVLFRGYAIRPHRTKVGRHDDQGMRDGVLRGERAGGFGQGAYTTFPSPEQSHYDLNMVGMWYALSSERRTLAQAGQIHRYAIDYKAPKDPTGEIVPWKVTDAIRDILKQAGFPNGMINITDNPIRLWQGWSNLNNIADVELTVQSDFAGMLVRLSELYLGQQIWFDANAATEGQWRSIRNAGAIGQTPLFHFTSYQEANPVPIDHGFVSGPLESYTVPPEYNNIRVVTTAEGLIYGSNQKQGSVSTTISNFDSFSPPGSTIPLNPLNPHYLGYEKTYFYIDPTLMGMGDKAYENGQRACDFTALRLFNLIGKARKIQPFHAPLYVIKDPETLRWRPMKFGDPVTFDGQTDWFARSVNPEYNLDTHQTAYYELEKVIPTSYGG